ncbi:MAG: hypothetical protein WD716_00010 [Fimbriimonadaceae bacterium]
MPTTNYYTVNGRIVGEKTTGGSRTDYVRDGLGSVVATTDTSGDVVNTYRYKPYGSQLSKTGAGADPKFLWIGAIGGRRTYDEATIYLRHRHMALLQAMFTSTDGYWPSEPSYGYAMMSPVTLTDPTGNYVDVYDCTSNVKSNLSSACDALDRCLRDGKADCKQKLIDCIGGIDRGKIESILKEMVRYCKSKGTKTEPGKRICVICERNLPELCKSRCDEGSHGSKDGPTVAETIKVAASDSLTKGEGIQDSKMKLVVEYCFATSNAAKNCLDAIEAAKAFEDKNIKGCDCVMIGCEGQRFDSLTFLHEMAHCVGILGSSHGGSGLGRDVVYRIESCIKKNVKL